MPTFDVISCLFPWHFVIPHRSDNQLIYEENEKVSCTACWAMRWVICGLRGGLFGENACMVRKCVVKVVLSKEQRDILLELSSRLGTSESESMRLALMDYVKELSLMSETIHRSRKQFSDGVNREN
jgi:hypothetical protein